MTDSEPRLSDVLQGYSVEGELGRGAMGEVYGGHHLRLGRAVAIKRLPQGFSADPEVRQRFGAEARVLASLDHPHVVPVYDFVESEDLCVLVMQALPGGTVWERFVGEGVSMTTACAIALATCAGLSHAHERNVLHRDVKPDNLMFDEHRQLKVTDFGIATVLGGAGTLATETGEVIGTPAYMAPEQADGSAVGPPADVYAVATMLYELLSGRLPFSEEGDAMDLLRRRLGEPPLDIAQAAPGVPAPIASVVMRGLERDPTARPRSAEDFGVELGRAAVEAWGPDWLARAEVKLIAGGALATAATSPAAGTGSAAADSAVRGSTASAGRETVAPGEPEQAAPRANETLGPQGAPVEGPLPPRPGRHPAPQPAATPPAATPPEPNPALAGAASSNVRPTRAPAARSGPDLSRMAPADMVPVSSLLRPPRAPWASLALAVVLGHDGCVRLRRGRGDGSGADEPGTATVLVAGAELTDSGLQGVDLSEPVRVRHRVAPGGNSDDAGEVLRRRCADRVVQRGAGRGGGGVPERHGLGVLVADPLQRSGGRGGVAARRLGCGAPLSDRRDRPAAALLVVGLGLAGDRAHRVRPRVRDLARGTAAARTQAGEVDRGDGRGRCGGWSHRGALGLVPGWFAALGGAAGAGGRGRRRLCRCGGLRGVPAGSAPPGPSQDPGAAAGPRRRGPLSSGLSPGVRRSWPWRRSRRRRRCSRSARSRRGFPRAP
ncbi:MAG: protein kinase [Microthrixaceae bacterium]